MLVNTFVMSNFNYCFLIWNFSSTQLLNKIENLQKRALRFFLNDYSITYEDLLEKYGCPNINLRTQRTQCIEIHRTLNNLNPGYMNNIFKLRNIDRLTREKYKLNLEILKLFFGKKSLRSCDPKIWNA